MNRHTNNNHLTNIAPHSYIFNSPKKLNDYTDEEIRNFMWYSKIEMRPDVYTQSFFIPKNSSQHIAPISLIRHLLKNIDINSSHKCLDFGTMNGILPVLMAKKGANVVTQESMPEYYSTVNLVKEAYNVDFEYLYDTSIYDLKLSRTDTFDVVLFCGIFYHLINPIIELAIARSFLKAGGIMLIETKVTSKEESSIDFFPVPACVHSPSLIFLEQLCRILCLEPIDFVYIGNREGSCRTAFACRAITSPALDLSSSVDRNLWHMITGKLEFSKINGVPIVNEHTFHTRQDAENTISYDLTNSIGLVSNSSRRGGIDLQQTILSQPNGSTFVKPKEILNLSDNW
jgi:SAM-dependent methyltransferase